MPPSLRAERTAPQKWKPTSCQTIKRPSSKRCAFTHPVSNRSAKRACPSPTNSEGSTVPASPTSPTDSPRSSPPPARAEDSIPTPINSVRTAAPAQDGPVSGLMMSYDHMIQGFSSDAAGGIVGREDERNVIREFLAKTVGKKRAGALYVSGKPGAGKTALVKTEVEVYRRRCKKFVVMNSMSLCDGAKDLFDELLLAICPGAVEENMDAKKSLETYFTAPHAGSDVGLTLLILDELDALLEHGQQRVLETIFAWAAKKGSRLVVIGIANALDLTHRFLPILHSTGCAPKLLSFSAYSESEILSILRMRIRNSFSESAVDDKSPTQQYCFEDSALDLCARRVSAESGDVRKAMEACREALKKARAGAGDKSEVKTGIAVMAQTLSKLLVCGQTVKRLTTLPLHQALLLCSMALAAEDGRERELEESLVSGYVRICHKQSLPPMSGPQMRQLLDALLDAGALVRSKSGNGSGKGKQALVYSLAIKQEQTVAALKTVDFYAKILQDGMRCSALAQC